MRYENFEELELYCYRVASVVGLLSIEIFGYQNPACRDYAVYLGKALQFTNILRDVKTDAARGRIYLPLDELKKFDVSEDEILDCPIFRPLFARSPPASPNGQKIFTGWRGKPCPPKTASHGRRRTDGRGLLAVAAKTGARQIRCLRPGTAEIEQAAQAGADFSILAAFRLRASIRRTTERRK